MVNYLAGRLLGKISIILIRRANMDLPSMQVMGELTFVDSWDTKTISAVETWTQKYLLPLYTSVIFTSIHSRFANDQLLKLTQ